MIKRFVYAFMFITFLFCQFSICFAAETADPTDPNRYLEAVREFADNVLKYGRDTYGPKHTPLFVDGLNIHTHEPVKWIDPDGTKWILSNLASQQNLFRTLDGLSKITGDPKYRQAAMDAIRYAFDNLGSPNGLLYWGSHASYNATIDQPSYEIVHELKTSYPFYRLMWQVDSVATKRIIEAFWSAHILDWSNLDFNRHGLLRESLEEPWRHEYNEDSFTFFEGKGLGLFAAATSLIQSGTALYRLSGKRQPLVWSRRLAKRYVDTRHPNTGVSKDYNYSLSSRVESGLKKYFADPRTGFLQQPFDVRHFTYPENIEAHMWISLFLAGEMIGAQGKKFQLWALEELTA